MAEKRKNRKKVQDIPIPVEDKATKQHYAIATYMKKNCPTKRTKFLNHQVNYFTANKAVDLLLDSQWATGKDVVFTDRQSCVDYCNKLLKFKFFHRAKKIPITDKDLKPKELKKKKEKEKEEERKKKESEKKSIEEKEKEKEKEKEEEEEAAENEKEGKEDEENADKDTKEPQDEKDKDKKKKKKSTKIKLDMHLEQMFIDGADAYVWMYDPIPMWYYFAGALVLFGAIAICLFPLWPPSVRKGVYYLSVAAAGFLGVILGLAVFRFVVFTIIWVLTFGHHHLWLLPNLTEDVGFFASFWPLYHYEYRGAGYDKKKKKKKKDQESDKEGETDKKSDAEIDSPDTAAETDRPETDVDRVVSEEQTAASETDSENSNSQTFEMVEKEDVDTLHLEEEKEEEEEKKLDEQKGSCVEEIENEDDKEGTIKDADSS